MGFQDIIALAIVATACYYVAKSVWKQMSGGRCGCDTKCSSEDAVERTRIKKTPLVTLELPSKTDATRKTAQDPHRDS